MGRELSSSLRNLKFMQNAIQREMVKPQGEESILRSSGVERKGFSFTSAVPTQPRSCVVITEGDPRPAAIRGRMSFKGFNPLIEKPSEASAIPNGDYQRKQHTETQNLNSLGNTNYSSPPYKGLSFNNRNQPSANPNGYHKRKQFEEVCDKPQYPNKFHKTNQGYRQSRLHKSREFFKKPAERNCRTRQFLGVKECNEKRLIITR